MEAVSHKSTHMGDMPSIVRAYSDPNFFNSLYFQFVTLVSEILFFVSTDDIIFFYMVLELQLWQEDLAVCFLFANKL